MIRNGVLERRGKGRDEQGLLAIARSRGKDANCSIEQKRERTKSEKRREVQSISGKGEKDRQLLKRGKPTEAVGGENFNLSIATHRP